MTRTDLARDARYQLRCGTHGEHVRLNHHPMLSGLTRPAYPIPRYGMLMAAYYHFYRAVENAIDASGDSVFPYTARRKLPWLVDDLAYLGIDPLAADNLPSVPLPAIPPPGVAELAGLLYTIEGSTLGGQVISRHLSEHQAITPERGGRFFFAYGQLTEQRWQQFESFLNSALVSDDMIARAVSTSRFAFALIEMILNDYHERVR